MWEPEINFAIIYRSRKSSLEYRITNSISSDRPFSIFQHFSSAKCFLLFVWLLCKFVFIMIQSDSSCLYTHHICEFVESLFPLLVLSIVFLDILSSVDESLFSTGFFLWRVFFTENWLGNIGNEWFNLIDDENYSKNGTLYDFHKFSSSSSFFAAATAKITTKIARNNFIFLPFTFQCLSTAQPDEWMLQWGPTRCLYKRSIYTPTVLLKGRDTSGFDASHRRILVDRGY